MIPLFTAALVASAAAEVILPPSNPPAQVVLPIPPFRITNFAAGALVLSRRNYVNFDVTVSPDTPPFRCQAMGTTLGETLGRIPKTWCTSASSSSLGGDEPRNVWFTWGLGPVVLDQGSSGGGNSSGSTTTTTTTTAMTKEKRSSSSIGASLRIVRQLSERTYDEAIHHFPVSDTPMVGPGMLAHQVYRGPANFSVDALRYCNQCGPRGADGGLLAVEREGLAE